ncbi:ABC transporter permease [Vibrio sp. SCSIO 43136]|uniref:ABC transporter permease n=1 Tax=Vibrio sp. SCSIO 43136 TaxID=2819101 RepID=UPI002075178A|nr:ABC transporter permease [Vibrio sp. SCSIO 43136]USD66743.1 ABC transporter permease [Vibrio sp. SCSIO 43136]
MSQFPLKQLMRWSGREIRHGQLWPIITAVILIVASVFALAALATRLEQVVVKQGRDALTADMVFDSSNPLPEKLIQLTQQNDITTSQLTRFATMAFSDEQMQLITIKAVDSSYPLRGELKLKGQTVVDKVSSGELWLDPRIMQNLEVEIGDNVTVGDADLKITGVIEQEPGLSFNPFQQMPTAYIHLSDIDKTGALQLGSRVRFRLFMNGEDTRLAGIQDQIETTPSDRWRDQTNQSRSSEIFDRTTQYLSLTVAIVILMAATTLVLTCQNYVAGRKKTIAMLKSIGASRQWVRRWLLLQVGLLFGVGAIVGIVVGIGLETALRIPLAGLLPEPLPSYGLTPAITALVTCAVIAIPALGIPLNNLLYTPAMSVMQEAQTIRSKSVYVMGAIPVIALLLAYADNVFVWLVLTGMVLLFGLLALISLALVKVLNKLPLSTAMRLALMRINRSGYASGIQFGALALSLMLLSIVWLVRTDLLQDWQRTLPPDAPNVFALNIADYERDEYLAQLDTQTLNRSEAYPIVRGRVAKINGEDAKEYAKTYGGNETDALRREVNFTWSDSLPEYNEVLEGNWTPEQAVSVESEVAQGLGIKLGDTLTFVINSQEVTAVVNTIRKVEWRDMKPNFYFIFSPDALASIPSTYLVSFRVDDQHNEFLNQLSRSYPTVSVLDVRSMGEKIQSLLGQIVWAITLLAMLGVIAGVLLIFTLLRLSLNQRQQEFRLYRTLGASKQRISRTIWCEYGVMALIAGVVAALGAEASVASIMQYGFQVEGQLHPLMWVTLPLATFIILGIVLNTLIRKLLIPMNKAV